MDEPHYQPEFPDSPEQQDADLDRPKLSALRLWLHPILMLIAGTSLVSVIGWHGEISNLVHHLTTLCGILFAVERILAYRKCTEKGRERKRLAWHAWLAVPVFLITLPLLFQPLHSDAEWSIGSHCFVLASVLLSGLASLIHHQSRFTARAFHPGFLLMGSFLFIIFSGTLLLKMPRCVQGDAVCTWIDALFTSTSAVCVTGLAVQNTASFFSPTGQMIILLLIQVGGLGIMTLTFFAAILLFEGLSLHDRLLLGKMLQENRLARLGKTLTFIVAMTFLCEAVGALILFLGMDSSFSFRARLYHSVFHSISAFCNAGFSTFSDGLASTPVQNNATWQVMVMLLVIIGGIGAFVVEDLTLWVKATIQRWRGISPLRHRLRIHTRLVLLVTFWLIFGGAALILLTEYVWWNGPINGGKILTALFHSVTTRTAGFNTVPMSGLGPLTIQLMMLLMLIGGSPGGTAGGIRTTVFSVGLAHLWSQIRFSKSGMLFSRRSIPRETGAQALGILVLAMFWLGINFVVLQVLEGPNGIPSDALLFELISAFATVGLSLDLTPNLSDASKMLLIINMYVGRIGLLTVLTTLVPDDKRSASGMPSEDIILT